ncbi:MAG: hypothetical protein ACI8RZ_001879 [Myxococcota bacterium]|jgi:hypothetical protein
MPSPLGCSTGRGLGRADEADAELTQAVDLSLTEGTPMETLRVLSERATAAEAAGKWDLFLALTLEASSLMAQSPEVSSRNRDRQAVYFQSALGRIAVAQGDLAAAKTALSRMDAAENTPASSRDSLAREIAVVEEDLEMIGATSNHFWQPECIQKIMIGDALWRAGSPEQARPHLEGVLASACLIHTHQRAALVIAHIDLAEIQREEGVDSFTNIRAARSLWPDPDADLPANLRLIALETGID